MESPTFSNAAEKIRYIGQRKCQASMNTSSTDVEIFPNTACEGPYIKIWFYDLNMSVQSTAYLAVYLFGL